MEVRVVFWQLVVEHIFSWLLSVHCSCRVGWAAIVELVWLPCGLGPLSALDITLSHDWLHLLGSTYIAWWNVMSRVHSLSAVVHGCVGL